MKIYALANELNLDRSNTGTITIPFGTWDYGEKKVEGQGGERTLFFRQTLNSAGAKAIADQIAASVAKGEKGVPVYWGHPDVPELAHKYPDKRAKGWIKSAKVEAGGLILEVEWLEENATEGFGWFSPYWTGTTTENGNQAMMNVNTLVSVALVNMPNIQEFRLANELQDTKETEVPGHAHQKLIEELAAKRDGVVKLANVTDANGLSHGEDGKFDGGNGSSSSSSGKSDDIKINEWDDPKTRKMKERLIKMREKNAALRDELANRRAALEKTKQASESIKNDIRRQNVETWKRQSRK